MQIFDLSWKRLSLNFFLLRKWTLKKKFSAARPGIWGARFARNARAARAQRAKRAIYLYTFFNLVLHASPKIALFLRVFAHSTRASGVVIFNKNFATFQVSKTNEKIGVFALSTRPRRCTFFSKIFAILQLFSKIFAILQVCSKIFAILQV